MGLEGHVIQKRQPGRCLLAGRLAGGAGGGCILQAKQPGTRGCCQGQGVCGCASVGGLELGGPTHNLHAPTTCTQGGRTPLHLACSGGHWEIAVMLLVSGADKDARDEVRHTPHSGHPRQSSMPADCRELQKPFAAQLGARGR